MQTLHANQQQTEWAIRALLSPYTGYATALVYQVSDMRLSALCSIVMPYRAWLSLSDIQMNWITGIKSNGPQFTDIGGK